MNNKKTQKTSHVGTGATENVSIKSGNSSFGASGNITIRTGDPIEEIKDIKKKNFRKSLDLL